MIQDKHSQASSRDVIKTILIACLLAGIFYITIIVAQPRIAGLFQSASVTSARYGVVDFLQYWSANKLTGLGQNPYDPHVMKDFQRHFADSSYTTMMWNPPWILLMLMPVLTLGLTAAAKLWFILNIIGIFAIVLLSERVFPSSHEHRWLRRLTIFFFPPFWNCLGFGQTSIALTLAFLLFVGCLSRNKDFAAGLILSVMSVKPHLIYLFALVLIWWAVKERRFNLITGAITGMTVLVGASLLFQGPAVWNWIQCHLHPELLRGIEGVIPPSDWVTPTVGGTIRAYGGPLYSVPMEKIIGFIALIPVAWWLVRAQPEIKWNFHLPLFVLLSLLLGPYGWFYDNSLLIIIVALVTSSQSNLTKNSYLLLLPLYLWAGVFATYFAKSQHEMFFFPVAMGIVLALHHVKSDDFLADQPISDKVDI